MSGLARFTAMLILFCGCAWAVTPEVRSVFAPSEGPLDTNPSSGFWRAAMPVYMDSDTHAHKVAGHRTQVLTRWTEANLYFLFVCPYEELNLKPNPQTSGETNQLWNWDVAEVFLGANFKDIKRYREFEVSPQGEWIDLDIDLHQPHHEGGWVWNSGFKVSARIDRDARVWYAAMRIPYAAVDTRAPKAGNVLRINLFRSQGPEARRRQIAWRAPMSSTFHVPERFGLLRLVRP
jgi:hypothetical protein